MGGGDGMGIQERRDGWVGEEMGWVFRRGGVGGWGRRWDGYSGEEGWVGGGGDGMGIYHIV